MLLSCLCLGALAGVAMGSTPPVAGAATVLRGIDDGALPGLAPGAAASISADQERAAGVGAAR